MEQSELIERFEDIKHDGRLLKKAFSLLLNASPKMAEQFINFADDVHSYNNYLTEEEATQIVDRLVNADGSTGAKWMPDTLFAKVQSLGGSIEQKPFFNRWALYAAMNMESSDHYKVLTKWCDGDSDRYAEGCFDLAVSQLTDADRMHWIRDYFNV